MDIKEIRKISGNEIVINSLIRQIKSDNKSVVPFIGAGMSISFGYPSWISFIRNAYRDFNIGKGLCDNIEKNLAEYNYEYAASILMNSAGLAFNDYFKDKFDDKFSQIKNLYTHPIHLLPNIFNGLYVTTNYDRVIENSYAKFYNGNKIMNVFHPAHKEVLNGVLRNTEENPILYKFHGCVSEPSSVILDETQYNDNYSADSDLLVELKSCFKSKIMLFLGCSLYKDRTMEVLSSVVEEGIENYCIIACEPDNYGIRRRELNDLGIKPIFYPDGNHECLYTILCDISSSVNTNFKNSIINSTNFQKSKFDYDSNYIEFSGRKTELKKLIDFCNSSRHRSWWAITGFGGSGKSRLAYELSKNLIDSWDIKHYRNYTKEAILFDLINLDRDTLFILDYVGVKIDEVKELFCNLDITDVRFRIRILLIDRNDYICTEKGGYVELITPSWLDLMYSKIGKSVCDENLYINDFLVLNKLPDETITKIITDFAKKNNVELNEAEIELLFENLKSIDPEFHRPLFAMMITEVYIDNNYDEIQSQKSILDQIYLKENQIFESKLRSINILEYDKIEIFKELLTIATMINGIDIKTCVYRYTEYILSAINEDRFGVSNLNKAGLASESKVLPLTPDIIGEYYFLKFFKEIRNEQVRNEIIKTAWKKPKYMSEFICRLFEDFYSSINEDFELYKSLFDIPIDNNNFNEIVYSLSNALPFTSENNMDFFMTYMDNTILPFSDDELIIIEYLKGLLNSIFRIHISQGIKIVEKIVEKIDSIATKYNDNEEIQNIRANGLTEYSYFLRYTKDEVQVEEVLYKLEELKSKYENNVSFAFCYFGALLNSGIKKPENCYKKLIKEVEKAIEKFPQSRELKLIDLKAHTNVCSSLNKKERDYAEKKAYEIARGYPEDAEITNEYYLFLFNFHQNTEVENECVNSIREAFMNDYNKVDKIVLELHQKDIKETLEAVLYIKKIYEKYYYTPSIAERYASSLAFLSNYREIQYSEFLDDEIEQLCNIYEGEEHVMVKCGMTLVNMSDMKDLEECEKIFTKIDMMWKKFHDSKRMGRVYEVAMFNLLERRESK